MTETKIIYNALTDEDYFRGCRDLLDFLEEDGNGLVKARKLVTEIEKYGEDNDE